VIVTVKELSQDELALLHRQTVRVVNKTLYDHDVLIGEVYNAVRESLSAST